MLLRRSRTENSLSRASQGHVKQANVYETLETLFSHSRILRCGRMSVMHFRKTRIKALVFFVFCVKKSSRLSAYRLLDLLRDINI